MFTKIFVSGLVLIVLAAVAAGVYQSTQAATAAGALQQPAARPTSPAGTAGGLGSSAGQGYGSGQGNSGTGGQTGVHQQLPAASDLSAVEAEGLSFMREEEKLAHDVYLALYEQWGLAIFQSISLSEQQHSDSVKMLLDIYGLDDPAAAQAGVFSNPELQTLYNELVARGEQSLAEALKVGAAIEEIDILDLQERLAQTDNADIQQVYNNLLRGSENHLRSFVQNLSTQSGETYQPQYLSVEAYQAILAGTNGNRRGAAGQSQGQTGKGGGRGYRGGRP